MHFEALAIAELSRAWLTRSLNSLITLWHTTLPLQGPGRQGSEDFSCQFSTLQIEDTSSQDADSIFQHGLPTHVQELDSHPAAGLSPAHAGKVESAQAEPSVGQAALPGAPVYMYLQQRPISSQQPLLGDSCTFRIWVCTWLCWAFIMQICANSSASQHF